MAAGRFVRDGWQGTGVVQGCDGSIITVVRYRHPPRGR